jgi:hypothetical protein
MAAGLFVVNRGYFGAVYNLGSVGVTRAPTAAAAISVVV